MEWADHSLELMWGAGLAAIPVALLAAACSRWKGCRPATRHAMWFAVLITLLSPIVTASLWRPAWFRSERVLTAIDSLATESPAKAALPDRASAGRSEGRRIDAGQSVNAGSIRDAVERLDPYVKTVPIVDASSPGEGHSPQALTATSAIDTVPVSGAYPKAEAAARPSPEPQPSILTEPARAAMRPSPVFAAPEKRSRVVDASGEVWAWLGQVLAVRDALAAVPPIPPLVLLAGAGALWVMWVVRIAMMQKFIRRGTPASEPLETLVRRLAGIAGVKRVPETLMVEDRVSPMIWCGLRPRLIIPRALWRELDSKCRCAVIVHELSHLRRRDHRLCWVEGLVGLFYWWHPVFWWARRRLRDEAESCCDAWVTTLLPGGRRAYAEALVATKSFLSVPGRSGAPGLGVISGRTRLLARRVTMVMTQRVAPRASLLGLVFALGIGATGLFVMPGLACPPEDEKPTAKASALKKTKAEKQAAEANFLGEAPALEAMKARGRAGQPAQDQDADNAAELKIKLDVLRSKEKALKDTELRLKEMERKLQQMQRLGGGAGGGVGAGPSVGLGGSAAPLTVHLRQPTAVWSTNAAAPRANTMTPFIARGAPAAPQPMVIADSAKVERAYELPDGKLSAMYDLMSRSDVPIFVRQEGNRIYVQATPGQHEVFGAFVRMIDPSGKEQATEAYQLMAPRAVTINGDPVNRALIEQEVANARAQAAKARNDGNQARAAAQQEAAKLRSSARTLEGQQRESARQYQQLMKQLEKLHEQIERLREQQENQRSDNDDEQSAADRAATDSAMAQLEHMDSKLSELDGLSEQIDGQLDAVMETVEALREAADGAIDHDDEDTAPEPAQPAEPGELPPEAALAPVPPMPPAAPIAGVWTVPAKASAPSAPVALSTGSAPATPAPASAPVAPALPPAPPAAPATGSTR